MGDQQRRLVVRSEIVRGLRDLGVAPGGILMAHTRMSALGWVVGGTQTVVEALLEAVGDDGTLMAYAGREDDTWGIDEWPADKRDAYLAELPAFDAARTAADRDFGVIPERLRTWPGSHRSRHPEYSVVAVGPRAEWLTADHPWDEPAGAGSPFAKLLEARGQVLMLGAPLETLTILHHAEWLADAPGKRRVTYRTPVIENGTVQWRTVRDIDTSARGAFAYEEVVGDGVDAFEVIGRDALANGLGRSGTVGDAECHLFDAKSLVAYAARWIEARFGERR